jgi:hypothetical protein
MYWWRIRPLRKDLDAAPPSGPAQVVYLTVFLVFEIFSWGLDTEIFHFAGNDNRSYWLSVALGLIAVKLLGPCVAYLAYRPGDPTRFTDRFIALSCPIRLRVLIFLLIALIPSLFITRWAEVVWHLPKGGLSEGNEVGLFWLAFNLWHYAWLAITLRAFDRTGNLPVEAGPI